MKNTRYKILSLGFLATLPIATQGSQITWGTAFSIAAPEDISNPPGSIIHEALDFNNATGAGAGDDLMINGITFTISAAAGTGNILTSMTTGPTHGSGFFTGATGDADLDTLLDSHAYTGANPAEITLTINGLEAGTNYQVQLIGVADARGCCAGRTYEPDDGLGNYTTGIEMPRGDFAGVLGTFTADAVNQNILWRSLGGAAGNSDAGFSGIVVIELPDSEDNDLDGLTNSWENLHGLNPNSNDSDGDLILDGDEDEDNDGLDNLGEQAAGTDPADEDTDNDTLLDGDETKTGIWNGTSDTGTHPLIGDSDGDSLSDGVENPDLPFVDENQTGSDPNVTDTDSDNLPDDVEVGIGYNPNDDDTDGNLTLDRDEDFDSDGSTNGSELANGTDIADDDSDDDGYLDGVETNTGAWVSATNTGTNPLDNDTDNDGLLDGAENPDLPFLNATQTGTNPHLRDTDEDLRGDGFEITNNSDPTDPGSFTALPEVSFLPELLGGDLTDPENDGIDTEGTAGANFNWVSITSSSKSFFTDTTAGGLNEGAFDVFDNNVGGGHFKWCCDAPPQDLTVEFEDPISITHFTLTSSNDSPLRDPVEWEIQGSDDGVDFTTIYRSTNPAIWTARNQTALFLLETPAVSYKFIRYQVNTTGDGTLHALGEIEYFGDAGTTPLKVTDISYNTDTNRVTLVWTSKPGRTYTVFTNTNLGVFDADVNDSVPSGGDLTTYEFPNPNPGSDQQFFKVVEN